MTGTARSAALCSLEPSVCHSVTRVTATTLSLSPALQAPLYPSVTPFTTTTLSLCHPLHSYSVTRFSSTTLCLCHPLGYHHSLVAWRGELRPTLYAILFPPGGSCCVPGNATSIRLPVNIRTRAPAHYAPFPPLPTLPLPSLFLLYSLPFLSPPVPSLPPSSPLPFGEGRIESSKSTSCRSWLERGEYLDPVTCVGAVPAAFACRPTPTCSGKLVDRKDRTGRGRGREAQVEAERHRLQAAVEVERCSGHRHTHDPDKRGTAACVSDAKREPREGGQVAVTVHDGTQELFTSTWTESKLRWSTLRGKKERGTPLVWMLEGPLSTCTRGVGICWQVCCERMPASAGALRV